MATLAACTIVAKACLSYARVLARSFRQHHPEIPFFVLLADEVDGWFDPDAEPFTLVGLSDLALPRFERFRFHYDQQPFTYACTPALIAWLHAQGAARVVYFKQETLVLGDLAPLFARLERAPVVVTPHLVSPLAGDEAGDREQMILQSGIYNVGVLGVAAGEASARFLAWWQDRLFADCRHDVPAGVHFEQRWLDLLPAFVEGVEVLRDPAYNVGHWSLPERQITVDDAGGVFVDGAACRVFRFSGYRPDEPTRATGYDRRLAWDQLGPARLVFDRVRRALDEEGYQETRRWPYAFGTFDNGVPVPEVARRMYLELGDEVERFGDPLRSAGPGSYWQWLQTPGGDTDLSRLWQAVRASRPDLQQAYPEVRGAGAAAFMTWARTSGLAEHRISAHWLERVWA